jgi:hypothetical protein
VTLTQFSITVLILPNKYGPQPVLATSIMVIGMGRIKFSLISPANRNSSSQPARDYACFRELAQSFAFNLRINQFVNPAMETFPFWLI